MACLTALPISPALCGFGFPPPGRAPEQALRCRDPSLAWCLEDGARWEQAARLARQGERLAQEGRHGKATELFTQVHFFADMTTHPWR